MFIEDTISKIIKKFWPVFAISFKRDTLNAQTAISDGNKYYVNHLPLNFSSNLKLAWNTNLYKSTKKWKRLQPRSNRDSSRAIITIVFEYSGGFLMQQNSASLFSSAAITRNYAMHTQLSM